jgi:hypothetical protein
VATVTVATITAVIPPYSRGMKATATWNVRQGQTVSTPLKLKRGIDTVAAVMTVAVMMVVAMMALTPRFSPEMKAIATWSALSVLMVSTHLRLRLGIGSAVAVMIPEVAMTMTAVAMTAILTMTVTVMMTVAMT